MAYKIIIDVYYKFYPKYLSLNLQIIIYIYRYIISSLFCSFKDDNKDYLLFPNLKIKIKAVFSKISLFCFKQDDFLS